MKRIQLAAYVFVVAAGAAGLWRVETTANRADQTANDVDHEAEIRGAQQCVSSYEVREQIRDAIETATRAGSEALIAIASDPEPRRVELFRQTIVDQVAAAREEVDDPDCDIEAARRVLDG